jgi:integrase
MKTKLTEAVVAKLACGPGTQLLAWDTELKGFGVLVSGTSGTQSYVVRGTINGRQIRKVVCDAGIGLKRARELAKDMLAGFVKGVDPRTKTAGNVTLGGTLEAYLKKRSDLRPHSVKTYRLIFSTHFKDWIDRPAGGITRDMVERRFKDIAEEVAARNAALGKQGDGKSSANNSMRVLRAVLGAFEDRPNPVKLKMNKERRRTRILNDADMAEFWRAIWSLENEVARDYLICLLFTGCRRGELTSLKWENVDFKNATVTFEAADTKSDEPLKLPMTDVVRDALVRRRAVGTGKYVFIGRSKGGLLTAPQRFLEKIEEETGIKVACHDFRRTFITACEMVEVSPHAQRLLVNHAVPKDDVHGGYIQYPAEKLRVVSQRVADHIKGLCGVAEPAGNVAPMRG